ncbi:ABC transporter [Treponema denticola F0402]|nr:ABC transporter [Treponema denticola F0402]
MSNTVIKIEHLSKMYKLGVINNGALFRDIQSWWALKRGKEDPHGKIGADKYEDSDTEFWALKDLTFDIKQGDRVGIIGKNGAGKSTLLKVLSRITTPTEGSVKIRGKVSSLLEVGTGFHGELTGRENIYLNGAILGMKKREIDRKLDEIIDFSGIEKHIDTPVKRYSSGMYVRLAFAVAAHLDSDILIADEVLAVGDAEFQKKAIGKMSELSTGQGRTVLFVSHNMAAVKSLCNKGVILEKGRLKFTSDNIDEAINKYQNSNLIENKISEWINTGDIDNIFLNRKKYI